MEYILIEPNKKECEIANKTLIEFIAPSRSEPKEKVQTASIFNSTLQEFMSMPNHKQYIGQTDVIISSDGPLNYHVVTTKVAKENLSAYKEMLSETGKVIATGLTSLLIDKKDIERENLTVSKNVQVTRQIRRSEPSTYCQLYIFSKHRNQEWNCNSYCLN